MKFVSIRYKIIPFLAIVIFAAVAGLSIYNYNSTKQQLVERLVRYEIPSNLLNVENAIRADFMKSAMIAELITKNSVLIDLLQSPMENEKAIQKYIETLTNAYGVKVGIIVDSNMAYFDASGFSRILTPELDSWYFKFRALPITKRLTVDWETSTSKLNLRNKLKVYDEDNQFVGAVYVRQDITEVANFILSQKIGDDGLVMMFDDEGNIRLHPDKKLLGTGSDGNRVNIQTIKGLSEIIGDVIDAKKNINSYINEKGQVRYAASKYIQQLGWYFLIDVSEKELLGDTKKNFRRNIYIALIITIMLISVSFFSIRQMILKPMEVITASLNEFGKGRLEVKTGIKRNDEIGAMADALKSVVKGLRKVSEFTHEIGRGNFHSDYTPLSEEDVLGQSILEMRNKLKEARNEEVKRTEQDKLRVWEAKGIELINGILRKQNHNLKEMSFDVLSNLIRYTNSNQGALFILNDEDQKHHFLEMTSSYAYSQERMEQMKIEIGEGLVGRCFIDRKKNLLQNIPTNYMNLSSGLGETGRVNLLLMPLANNEEIYGVLEIASLKHYEEYEIGFLERVCESIAAAVYAIKTSIRTEVLLEQTRHQARKLQEQEGEMLQNMEELRATQEKLSRREQELVKELEELRKN